MRSIAVRAAAPAVVLAVLSTPAHAAQGTPPTSAAEGGVAALSPAAPRVLVRSQLAVRGDEAAIVRVRVRHGGARARVALQTRRGGTWRTVATARVSRRAAAVLRVRGHIGRAARLAITNESGGTTRIRLLGRVQQLRRSFASWYGPGFYGNRTACGQRFSASLMGVAHKTLPCGTRVTFRLGGRVVSARVLDRGPFRAGREFDLSPAVKSALGFGSTGTVWVSHR